MTGRVWQILIAALVGVAILVGLGVWQLERLAQKEALIAERDSRLNAPPVKLDEALKKFDDDASIEYLKVAVEGSFQHDAELYMLTTHKGEPGFDVVTPLADKGGVVVLIDRGFVPEALKDPAQRPQSQPQGDVKVVGIVRRHVASRGPFTPDNDPAANMWYWWDVPAMLAFAHIGPDAKVAPFVLHLLPGPTETESLPRPVAADEPLANNHLQYALTWFALAVILIVISGLLIRQTLRKEA